MVKLQVIEEIKNFENHILKKYNINLKIYRDINTLGLKYNMTIEELEKLMITMFCEENKNQSNYNFSDKTNRKKSFIAYKSIFIYISHNYLKYSLKKIANYLNNSRGSMYIRANTAKDLLLFNDTYITKIYNNTINKINESY